MLLGQNKAGLVPENRRQSAQERTMPAFIQQFINSFKAVWAKMSQVQRMAVAGGAVALLAGVIGLSIWMGRSEYRVL